jgi:hypothetical protein
MDASPSGCPISGTSASGCGSRGMAPGERSAKDVGTRADDGLVCVATAKCSTVSMGVFGAPVTVSAVEAPASPLIMTQTDDGYEDRAAMVFLGTNLMGSRLRPALQGARG